MEKGKKVAGNSQLNTCKEDKMGKIKGPIFVEVCKKCGRKFQALTEEQAKANMTMHEFYCKPSQLKNGKV